MKSVSPAKHRAVYFLSANLCLFGLLLYAGSLATEHLIQGYVWRNTTSTTAYIGRYPDSTKSCDRGAFLGTVHFGHFYGKKCLNYGLGVRIRELDTQDLYTDIYHYRFWVLMSMLGCLAMVTALASIVVSLCMMSTEPGRGMSNCGGKAHLILGCLLPIEMIGLIAIIVYQLRYHFSAGLLKSEDAVARWTTERVFPDYSFLLVFLSWLMFLFNFLLLMLSHCDQFCKEKQRQSRIMRRRSSSRGQLRSFTKECLRNDEVSVESF